MNAALTRACKIAGSQARLAGLIGVTPQAVHYWAKNPIPAERCPAVENATGVRCDDLRPDLSWERDHSGAVTGYRVRLSTDASTALPSAA